jgi:membrane-bound lytic murein transglycosylase D
MIAQRFRILLLLAMSVSVIRCAHGSSIDSNTIKQRLSVIENRIPLPFHERLIDDIVEYTDKQLPSNFPLFESGINEEIRHFGLPDELIYLPVALTNLKLDYHQEERAGIWALPALIALRYGLTVDETHDERYTIEASTYAAMRYLTDLYEEYGDWWLCLLAYVNSPSALQNAQLRHPEAGTNPWIYYDNEWLPNVKIIGHFIASYYVYSSDDKSITHTTEQYGYCSFDQPVSVAVISAVTGLQENNVKRLNPMFKTDPFQPLEGYALRLPKSAAQLFENNRERIYSETATQKVKEKEASEKKAIEAAKEKEKKEKEIAQKTEKQSKSITYTVKLGDTLGKIAQQHHVKISDLKKWNHLKSDFIRENQKLTIYP